mmetsp:Transcript_12982/g.18549  ORF Transcript_12982/g.18549 Transcript_12982/m.18549 type:complete len:191 (-) Transcript_12982:712-1284(-)
MKFSTLFSAAVLGSATAFSPATTGGRISTQVSESKADLEAMSKKLNPIVGYFDPLGLTEAAFWGQSNEFTIGFLRQAEIKHGRVAMAAFVGYCVQSNFQFPWSMTMDGTAFPGSSLSPPEQWDALPLAAKIQIILFIGFLEWYSELTPGKSIDDQMIVSLGISHHIFYMSIGRSIPSVNVRTNTKLLLFT